MRRRCIDGFRGAPASSSRSAMETLFALMILVTTVIVALTAPQLSESSSAEGGRCFPVNFATNITFEAECKLGADSKHYEGDCWTMLLQRGPCPNQHWLVVDNDNGTNGSAHCQFQVCPNHEVLVGGQCERLGNATSNKHCPPTQQLIISRYGEAVCECPMGKVYYRADHRCYHPYDQGPCQQGHALQVLSNESHAECVPSLCPSGEVALTQECEVLAASSTSQDYSCYRLSTMGPCKQGFLALHPFLMEVACIGNIPYSIWFISKYCRKDHRGKCREEFFPRSG